MGFSKRVRRLVTTVGVITPFILSLGSASAHVVTAQHASHAAVVAHMADGGSNTAKGTHLSDAANDNKFESSAENGNKGNLTAVNGDIYVTQIATSGNSQNVPVANQDKSGNSQNSPVAVANQDRSGNSDSAFGGVEKGIMGGLAARLSAGKDFWG